MTRVMRRPPSAALCFELEQMSSADDARAGYSHVVYFYYQHMTMLDAILFLAPPAGFVTRSTQGPPRGLAAEPPNLSAPTAGFVFFFRAFLVGENSRAIRFLLRGLGRKILYAYYFSPARESAFTRLLARVAIRYGIQNARRRRYFARYAFTRASRPRHIFRFLATMNGPARHTCRQMKRA